MWWTSPYTALASRLARAPRSGLQESGEVAARSPLRNAQLDGAGAGLSVPIPVAMALVDPALAALARGGAGQASHVHLRQPLGRDANLSRSRLASEDVERRAFNRAARAGPSCRRSSWGPPGPRLQVSTPQPSPGSPRWPSRPLRSPGGFASRPSLRRSYTTTWGTIAYLLRDRNPIPSVARQALGQRRAPRLLAGRAVPAC